MSTRKKRAANSGPMSQEPKLSPVRKRGKNKKQLLESQAQTDSDSNIYNYLPDDSEDDIITDKAMEAETVNTEAELNSSTKSLGLNLKKKTKIITVENMTVEAAKTFLSPIQLQQNYQLVKKRGNVLQIQCNSNDDKIKVLEKLKDQQHSFYTYSENEVKTQIFVLKRHHFVTPEILITTMKNENIPVTRISMLKNDKIDPIYLVHFEKDVINFFTLISKHSTIDNLIIKWEKFRKAAKRLTQCHRCQQYGHSSINCGKQFKCIKCISIHEPGQCERKTREGSPQCCNCKLFHSANSKICTFYIDYKEKISKFKKAPIQRTFKSTMAPWAPNNSQTDNYNQINNSQMAPNYSQIINQENFPEISNNNAINNENYKKNIENNNFTFNQFTKDQNEFSKIPEIGKTMQLFGKLVNELKSTSDHGARLAIMMQYCSPNNVN